MEMTLILRYALSLNSVLGILFPFFCCFRFKYIKIAEKTVETKSKQIEQKATKTISITLLLNPVFASIAISSLSIAEYNDEAEIAVEK
jgi:hypothetical protein